MQDYTGATALRFPTWRLSSAMPSARDGPHAEPLLATNQYSVMKLSDAETRRQPADKGPPFSHPGHQHLIAGLGIIGAISGLAP